MKAQPGSNRKGLVKIPGTEVPPLIGVPRKSMARSRAPLTLTIQLRARDETPAALEQIVEDIVAGRRAPLDRKEFAAQFGARPEHVAALRRFAKANGFRVSQVSVARRVVQLSGTRGRLARAFGVNAVRYDFDGTSWQSLIGSIYLPTEIAPCIRTVFGFNERPDLQRAGAGAMSAKSSAPKKKSHNKVAYTAVEVGDLYEFPKHLDGKGQSIAVIALGGGYLRSDMEEYFRELGLPMPDIRWKSVHGARNEPNGDTAMFDGEVTGDIQTAGAIAPGAKIVVYFAPNTHRGFFEAISEAVHDPRACNTVVSISWGQAEGHWRRRTVSALNRVLLEAAALGVTVCCSSGDFGAYADQHDRVPHVNFPGSSPYALACGGTTLIGSGDLIHSERVWNNHTGASGGGVSSIFELPAWQRNCRVPKTSQGFRGRGVPDVGANADPLTGYRVYLRGKWEVGAGTSAASPLWAGLVARFNQERGGPVGLITPFMYDRFSHLLEARAMVVITKGGNRLYRARKGWSACTGLGTPRGLKLTRALTP
jgi:kumamolisin